MSLDKVPTHPLHVLKGHTGPVYTVKFNKNGQYCISGSQDRKIILWNPQKGKLIKTYTGAHNYEINDLIISEDNNKFVSAGGDKMAFIWDVKTGKIIKKFSGHTQKLNCLAYNSDESVLITGSYDTQVKFWDLKSHTHSPIQTLKNFKDSVTKIIVDEYNIFASCMDGHVYNFDIRMGELDKDNLRTSVHNMAISNDQKTYVASTTDNKINLVERSTGQVLQQFQGHRAQQYSIGLQYSWDDAYIISGSEDGYMYVYDFFKGDIAKKVKNNNRTVSCVSLNNQRDCILTGSFDSTITYWSFPERKEQIQFIQNTQFDSQDPQNYMYQNNFI